MWIMGTDEAGYGPNLGPLVISATLWQVPDADADADLYERLAAVVTRRPSSGKAPDHTPIADSKVLYKGHGSLANLEYGLGAALWAAGVQPETARSLGDDLAAAALARETACPWHDLPDAPFPQDADRVRLRHLGDALRDALKAAGIRLWAVRSRAVFPGEFNETVERVGNKAEALSQWTLQLAKQLLATTTTESVLIHCDKHGGRNRYAALLQQAFPDHLVQVRAEGRATSQYEWRQDGRQIIARFVAGGENFLPSALASMASKYLRELAMQAFNAFWLRHVAELKPTAGYPLDARRFLADIAAVKERLAVPDDQLWRRR